MAKKLPIQSAICTECHAHIEAAPVPSLVGLLRFKCPNCTKAFLYPLSDRRRTFYVAMVVCFGVLSFLLLVFAHVIPIPGILPVALVVALVQDNNARKKLALAQTLTGASEGSQLHSRPPVR